MLLCRPKIISKKHFICCKNTVHTMTNFVSFRNIPLMPAIEVPSHPEIKLSPEEDQLCTLLDGCKKELQAEGLAVECRIAGGWVRDKLLKSTSNDIDVALSNIMGVPFAERFARYVSSKGLTVRPITKILQNPDQSKHLETAKTKLLDIDLDFVNLRSEEYAVDSRIPTGVAFGTPLQDAERRDITMNALFYNVHTREVEDHTNKGLDDLKNGLIRTPLPSKTTFLDDPLRVIRCIRFASRFGFRLDSTLAEAAQDAEIQNAILTKISRERVGEELDKMLRGRDPLHSIRLINDLSLQQSLFSTPQTISPHLSFDLAEMRSSLGAASILHALLTSPETISLPQPHPLLISQISKDPTLRARLFLAAALTPYKGSKYIEKKKEKSAVEGAIREGLKLGVQNHYLDGIPALFTAAELLHQPFLHKFPERSQRSQIGLLLRNKSIHNANSGSHWTSSILFSLVQELTPLWNPEIDQFDVDSAIAYVNTYNAFVGRVEELQLVESIDAKTLLDGREIGSILGISKPGPWTGQVLAKVLEWQLQYPERNKEDCVLWLKDAHLKGQILSTSSFNHDKSDTEGGGAPSKKSKTIK